MIRPNFIPRTLKGLCGKFYFDIPGVSYPKELLEAKVGYCPQTGKAYKEKQNGGLTTREAADILCSSISSARAILRKYKIGYRIVCENSRPPIIYWNGDEVENIAQSKPQHLIPEQYPNLLSVVEAAKFIGVGRSTIQRAVNKGTLSPVYARVDSEKGTRIMCFLRRSEIIKLQQQRRAKELRRKQKKPPHMSK